MAQEIQRWTPSTALSPEQKWNRALERVRYSTSRQQALEYAKKLVGCYPHAKPPDPEAYAAGLADVLEQYPLGVVQECCDPRTGIARTREFPPTVAALVAWCGLATRAYKALSARPMPLPEPVHTEEHCATMRERIKALFNGFRKVAQ